MPISKPILRIPQSRVAYTTALVVFCGALSSCEASTGTNIESKLDENALKIAQYPSVLDLFSCKPADAAFVAAHRGTHEGSVFPENTTESLQALASAKVKFAEIDVARLKDGTLIYGTTAHGKEDQPGAGL